MERQRIDASIASDYETAQTLARYTVCSGQFHLRMKGNQCCRGPFLCDLWPSKAARSVSPGGAHRVHLNIARSTYSRIGDDLSSICRPLKFPSGIYRDNDIESMPNIWLVPTLFEVKIMPLER